MARNNMRTTKRAPKDLGRRIKKKPCQLCKDHVAWVDYKNFNMLKRYMSERGKIRARRVSGNCTRCTMHCATHYGPGVEPMVSICSVFAQN